MKHTKQQLLNKSIVTIFDNEYKNMDAMLEYVRGNKDFILHYRKHIKNNKDRFKSKNKQCFLCGVDFDGVVKSSGVCKSHNIPEFILKNVATKFRGNNNLATISSICENINYKEYEGAKNCDTFNLICKNCDSNLFSEYENPEALETFADKNPLEVQAILSKIALKIQLKDLYFYNITQRNSNFYNTNNTLSKTKLKNSIKNAPSYKLIYSNKLDYNVGFTVQDKVLPNTLLKNDAQLNDLKLKTTYNDDSYIYICVYPLKDETLVLVFTEESGKDTYEKYIKFVNSEHDNLILRNLSYNILKFTEKIYFNPITFPKEIWSEKDKLLVNSEYLEVVVDGGFKVNSDDYLKLKSVTEKKVTNLFKVNKGCN